MSKYNGPRRTQKDYRGLPITNGVYEAGVWKCGCTPPLIAAHFETKKAGLNQGRWFWCCGDRKTRNGCGFFLWDDDAKIIEDWVRTIRSEQKESETAAPPVVSAMPPSPVKAPEQESVKGIASTSASNSSQVLEYKIAEVGSVFDAIEQQCNMLDTTTAKQEREIGELKVQVDSLRDGNEDLENEILALKARLRDEFGSVV
ncbi:hypothetical protein V1512DRAFT_275206 [Lipomyces arxii]|uniref:uncharacterized protein n=1 Tax=Lipomyces arxii TaxID=56418 RepID=UPI0034CF54DE